ncbi:type II CRISPR RNA-guided endonuclease Cas9 [Algoriphagus sp. NG3]|uniref:type II CRISPR RNA-guided endonuclease Cas9 n=1 Tax=Algoriphagus sp. NG3 TaxID=3097546 RepID=UPI002A80AF43|nr:type II CRISPR RNA-guided endonuclease Cas9 [Algoriphagus sp. NG3]WPR76614.1 type II CRISPR RNA-guided endonuclease Cas9 [Algoriphagus sp. NG3]
MKKILGLDLGTASIGWAFIKEPEKEVKGSQIIDMGVRIVPLTSDEENDFSKGNSISINADRTLKRGARRNLQRYKQRRNALIEIFKNEKLIPSNFQYAEDGPSSTFSTLKLRSDAANERIELEGFLRVLLQLNKKRGYKSSRKAKSEEDEGQAIDSMGIAKELYENGLTPGQWVCQTLKSGRKNIPDFYRSDLQDEFKRIVSNQAEHYPEILNDAFVEDWMGKAATPTKQFFNRMGIQLAENKGKRDERKLQEYQWRLTAINSKLELSEIALILSQINSQISNSSGYLGAISDRSKELYFKKLTVGQYLYDQVKKNPHTRLKGQVFYRQDYLDEFEKLWEVQSQFHSELKEKLKNDIRDVIIFYQRRLKSQKHLISECEFEKYHKVTPKSHPCFQEFRIWQNLNNLVLIKKDNPNEKFELALEDRNALAEELAFKKDLSLSDALKLMNLKPSEWELNFQKLEGNRTNHTFYEAFARILEIEDGESIDLAKMKADDILDQFSEAFVRLGIDPGLLRVNDDLEGNDYENQPYLQFWHLLYSSEDDQKLKKNLIKKFGFKPEHTKILLGISLQDDHASLSSKAIKKILPHLQTGLIYDKACTYGGYNHSSSLTKEDNDKRKLKTKLDLLKKNSLRNPVVEKILDQMTNVVNAIINDPNLGQPDEIRIEMARELKANAEQRKNMTSNIASATRDHEKFREILKKEFGLKRVTKNDLLRYKLWLETDGISIYTGKPIEASKLFSKEYDIEHVIPKARLFDDSFSNKTICERQLNIDKANVTAFSFLQNKFSPEEFEQYQSRVKSFYGKLGKAKIQKLLMANDKIPEDFIARQLQETRYISKKAKELLLDATRRVTVTTGSITDKLREDWGLIEVMKELNWDKYDKLGLTYTIEGKNGERLNKIKDWSKRNDHRHHAMDALTVALTKPAYIQYLNNLNARDQFGKKGGEIYAIEQKYLERVNGRIQFISPIPNIRIEAKRNLSKILVSYKAKNKVVTINKNKTKKQKGFNEQIVLTPRGQLHKETVYGKSKSYTTKFEKVGGSFDQEKINTVAKKEERETLFKRLAENNNDPKKAFTGKNALTKMPIYLNVEKNTKLGDKVKTVSLDENFTIRKNIDPELKIDKVIDVGVKRVLENRLNEYGGNAKLAFSNLEENPIWLNQEKGISIKRVKISGVSNVESLHVKRDHFGKPILDQDGKEIPVDFVSTGNNHHVAVYEDQEGNLQEQVVSFFEAVVRKNQNLPIVNKNHPLGWKFLFTLKQNEFFVFPSNDFDPSEIDLQDERNYHLISLNLYRVQKIGTKDYTFRHHLETVLNDLKELDSISYHRLRSPEKLRYIKKVRINHLGKIIHVGEF